jgi:M6 family metalloprotease-like protein
VILDETMGVCHAPSSRHAGGESRWLAVSGSDKEGELMIMVTSSRGRRGANQAIFAALLLSVAVFSALAAPLSFVPQRIIQPNGTILECFASGDEYHNWLHDANGYTIIQDHTTGYYVYAVAAKGGLVPTPYVAGQIDPASMGLQPWQNYSPETMSAKRAAVMAAGPPFQIYAPTAGSLNNIAVFIRFSDETEWTDKTSKYQTMFNAAASGTTSLYNYYMEVSYGAISVSTSLYPVPQPADTTVISYQDSHPRGYYQPYDSTTNPIGYKDADRTKREQTMLAAAIRSVRPQIPAGLNLDSDGDGYVDNICFIVKGSPTAWSTLLWPHAWSLYTDTVSLNGKRVYDYNLQLQSMMTVGVLTHEMGHTLGAPDLYRYTNTQIDPVANWDIMATNVTTPMHMGAYMKWKYGKWISSIPLISTPGRYFLRPLGTNATENAYRVASPFSSTEYFVLEYRKKNSQASIFEKSLPGEGLLVYRINTSRNGDANGPPDEIYVYRPGGALTVNGTPSGAALSRESGRDTLADDTNPWPFLSTGKAGGLTITDVGVLADTIAFTLGRPVTAAVESLMAVKRADSVVVTWKTRMQYRCKGFEIQRAYADTGVYGTISGSYLNGTGTVDSAKYYRWVDRGNLGETYYRVTRIDSSNVPSYSAPAKVSSVSEIAVAEVPVRYTLSQNYPNPFNPTTTILYSVEKTGPVSVKVYDLLGRHVVTLYDAVAEAGRQYQLKFDGKNYASGVYHYVLLMDGRRDVRRMVLLR